MLIFNEYGINSIEKYRVDNKPDWYTAERYDYCEHIPLIKKEPLISRIKNRIKIK